MLRRLDEYLVQLVAQGGLLLSQMKMSKFIFLSQIQVRVDGMARASSAALDGAE